MISCWWVIWDPVRIQELVKGYFFINALISNVGGIEDMVEVCCSVSVPFNQ